jgi:hypothetical protein
MSAAPRIPEPVATVDDDGDVLPTVELAGRRFPIREQGVSLLALMRFATVAKAGGTSDDMEGLAALYALLRTCIAETSWDAFEDHANQVGADGEALMHVVTDAVTAAAARPTRRPLPSPGGRSTTAPNSAAGSSSPASPVRQGDPRVQADLETRGRPDLALVVQRAREASTASSTG